jgi:hypothetical protein
VEQSGSAESIGAVFLFVVGLSFCGNAQNPLVPFSYWSLSLLVILRECAESIGAVFLLVVAVAFIPLLVEKGCLDLQASLDGIF